MCSVSQMLAVPAAPYPVQKTQPDGSTLTVHINGDEFYHFYTTTDGYTVVKNDLGCFTYAQRVEGRLVPTAIVAHNPAERNATEQLYLSTLPKRLTDAAQVAEAKAEKAKRQVAPKALFDYSAFRGLIVLVQFNDYTFSRSDANAFYSAMVNQKGYTGFVNEDGSAANFGNFTGSVRDYYEDNSNGMFAPTFDVVGPITVPYSITNSYSNLSIIMRNALNQATSSYGVDYTKYDADGNGYVDMVYFIAAGFGSNYSGNDTNYLWPHKSSLAGYGLWSNDGVKYGTYACSTERYGWESQSAIILDGIGTICHEFSHVIGLRDIYDTDYETNGQSNDPGKWDVMAGGSYLSYSRRPVGYTGFERYALGFLAPKVLSKAGSYTLNPVENSPEAYILPTSVDKEYFIIDNRQQTQWDVEAPGHGMMVYRVDSTDVSVWTNNKVNAYSSHNYFELLRAGNGTSKASDSDPFPGTTGVTTLSAETKPALVTWNGTATEFAFSDITETNGVISFKLKQTSDVATLVEDFETIGTDGVAGATGVQGRFCSWDFTKSNVVTPTKTGVGEGQYALAMVKPSAITTTQPLSINPFMASVHFYNPGTTTCKFVLQYRLPDSDTWTEIGNVSLSGGTNQVTSFTIPTVASSAYFRVSQTSGSTTSKVYADNITFYYYRDFVLGDLNQDGTVDVADVTVLLNIVLNADISNPDADINADGTIDIADVTALINIILS